MNYSDNNWDARLFKLSNVAKSGEDATKTVFYSTDSTTGAVWVVKPGQEVVAHKHSSSDDLWICIQGSGMFYPQVGAEKPIQKGDVVLSRKDTCHGMKNTGDEDFIFVSVIAPVPSDFVPL